MKVREEVTADKIRGGFYSPDELVGVCLDRIESLTRGKRQLDVLEPGSGDGAFLRGLAVSRLTDRLKYVSAIEPLESEAAKSLAVMEAMCIPGEVIRSSVVRWGVQTDRLFDVAIGNPPFVRYQFMSAEDKAWSGPLGKRLGVSFGGVSNLWIPVLLSALSRLKPGGAFAFIIPTECFTGISAGVFRSWLSSNIDDPRLDLFPPRSFPGVLQEVLVLSGVRRLAGNEGHARLCVYEHDRHGNIAHWDHLVPVTSDNWTRYLLAPDVLDAVDEASQLPQVFPLKKVAKFEVAVVTGANDYFSVDAATLHAYDLTGWTVPLLPRTKHAKGLCYTSTDYAETVASGARAFLLDFSSEHPSPLGHDGPRKYIEMGKARELPARYKCRIREPWFRVPLVKPGAIMLSKRSHRFPRVILNEARVVTTDTIYRGSTIPKSVRGERDLVAAFHNSLTLLTAELEGRSFGGGVMELVPTEVGRLLVPIPENFGQHLAILDRITRSSFTPTDAENLIDATDRLLVHADIGFSSELLSALRRGRDSLLQRRLDRN